MTFNPIEERLEQDHVIVTVIYKGVTINKKVRFGHDFHRRPETRILR